MDRFQRLAAAIIDIVEHTIREVHPEVDEIASKCEGNTLLHGEAYYTLEDEIAIMLRKERNGLLRNRKTSLWSKKAKQFDN